MIALSDPPSPCSVAIFVTMLLYCHNDQSWIYIGVSKHCIITEKKDTWLIEIDFLTVYPAAEVKCISFTSTCAREACSRCFFGQPQSEARAETPPIYEHRTPSAAQQSMCRSATLFLLWTCGILDFFIGFYAVFDPIDANPRVGKLFIIDNPRARGGWVSVCFVEHSAPFS